MLLTADPQITLVACVVLVPVLEPQMTLKALSTLLLQGNELPQITEVPLTFAPQITDVPQITDDPQITDVDATLPFPSTRLTTPVDGL